MITCDNCGFGHSTYEEKAACKPFVAPMPESDIAAALARAERATPPPWRHCSCGKCGLIWDITGDGNVVTAETDAIARAHDEWGDSPEPVYGRIGEAERQANAEFIAAARTDIPRLCALVATQREAMQAAADALDIIERELVLGKELHAVVTPVLALLAQHRIVPVPR